MTLPESAIITGAAGGIGSALARKLAAGGTRLVLAGRTLATLEPLAAELGARAVCCDVTDSEQVVELVRVAQEDLGEIHAAAHCVGSILLKPAHLTTLDEWRAVMDVNLNSSFYLLSALARPMMKSGGAITFVTSVAGERGLSNHEAIGSAKAGLAGLVRSAAATYAKKNLRINAVAPGLTETVLASPITSNENAKKFSEALHPLGRLGRPEEIAQAISFLLSPENSWITGQVLSVDGGLSTLQAS